MASSSGCKTAPGMHKSYPDYKTVLRDANMGGSRGQLSACKSRAPLPRVHRRFGLIWPAYPLATS